MLKFTNHLSNSSLVLIRQNFSRSPCSALVIMRAPARKYSQEKCPDSAPTAPKRSRGWVTLLGATVLVGSAVVYVKHSDKARGAVAANAPWADDFVAFIYQEKETYGEALTKPFKAALTYCEQFLFGREGVTPKVMKSRADENLEQDIIDKKNARPYELPPPKLEPLYVEKPPLEEPVVEENAKTVVIEQECDPERRKPVEYNITESLVELEHNMHQNTKIAVDNYTKAKGLCKSYNEALYKLIEAPADGVDRRLFTELCARVAERDATVARAQDAGAKATAAIDQLERMLESGAPAPPEALAATARYVRQFRADLARTAAECRAELDKAVIGDKYWKKVEEARNAYKEQLQVVVPGIDLTARQLSLGPDADLFLLYTMKQTLFLQNELAALQTVRDQKLKSALASGDDKELIELKAEDIVMKERIVKEREFQQRAFKQEVEAAKKLKEALKKQMEIQQEVHQSALKKKEAEIMSSVNRQVSEQVQKDRLEFKKELAEMTGKMMAIEQAMKNRSKAEGEARKAQTVWAAGEALLAATRRPFERTCVENEVNALEKAGKDDNFVKSVIGGISKDAKTKPIPTEKTLRDNFYRMEKAATQVALVDKDGASLPVYLLSWLQSKLLFSQLAEVPRDELENKPVDFSKLDTFDVMHRARYHMEQGNITDAVRYVNLLQGAPRVAARGWLDDAKKHLEVKQAAEAVMAHASASAMMK